MSGPTPAGRRSWRGFTAILFAVFAVGLGYGAILPVLPSTVERLLGSSQPDVVARHIALLTGAYAMAPLAAAYPWGRLSDRYGRKPILLVSLLGFAATLAASALASGLPFLYVTRLLTGGFASAVLPTALAFAADSETNEAQRARYFGWIIMAANVGLLAGPLLGGFGAAWDGTAWEGIDASSREATPFLLVAGLAATAAVAAGSLTDRPRHGQQRRTIELSAMARVGESCLLVLGAASAAGLGAFEVGLTLRSRGLAMTPSTLGLMFAACMIVMLIVQGLAFSPLVKPLATRWLIAPSFAVMAIGLVLIPIANGSGGILFATGLVAASGGFLAPTIAYWVSRISGRGQGAELGLQSAVVSLGQTLGSVSAGLFFGFNGVSKIAFILPAVAIAVVAAVQLPAQLAISKSETPNR